MKTLFIIMVFSLASGMAQQEQKKYFSDYFEYAVEGRTYNKRVYQKINEGEYLVSDYT